MAEIPPDLPRPEVAARRKVRISLVWILPAIAALVALSLFFERIALEGPDVVITFSSADGIEPGKTPIRYRNVTIGEVIAVDLSPDYRTAEVRARIDARAAALMTEGAAFWIVRPRVTLSGISGLGTLFSGNYIAFERGLADRPQRRFDGLENARVVASETPGREFVLRSREASRIDAGLPVYYLGLPVGQVTSAEIASGGGGIDVHIFVDAPYDQYVRAGSRFWNASGVDLSLHANEVSVRTESLVSLLVGGIAFEDAAGGSSQAEAAPGSRFVLHHDRASALKPDESDAARYVLFFDEPVDGLQSGSPVMLLGVPVGEVTHVGLVLDRRAGRVRARVDLRFSPERALQFPEDVRHSEAPDGVPANRVEGRALLGELVAHRNLRAQLRTGSLLTGQRYVAFDYFSRAQPAHVDWQTRTPVLPTVPSLLPAFEEKLARLMDKLDALPAAQALADARSLMQEAQSTFAGVTALAADVDRKALPAFTGAMEDAGRALEAARRTLDGASATLVGPGAPGQRELRSALQEMTRAARALRVLSDSIERHPESIVWGRPVASTEP